MCSAKYDKMLKAKRKAHWRVLPEPAREFVKKLIEKVKPLAIYYLGENNFFLYEVWEDAAHEFIVVVEDGEDWTKGIQVYWIQKEVDERYSATSRDVWIVAAVTVEESDFYKDRGRAAEIFAGFAIRYGTLV